MADRDLELLREEVRAHRKESQDFIRWMAITFEGLAQTFRDLQVEIADMRDEIQANTRAVLKVLDKLDEPPRAQA